jgi:hypothetical protein
VIDCREKISFWKRKFIELPKNGKAKTYCKTEHNSHPGNVNVNVSKTLKHCN